MKNISKYFIYFVLSFFIFTFLNISYAGSNQSSICTSTDVGIRKCNFSSLEEAAQWGFDNSTTGKPRAQNLSQYKYGGVVEVSPTASNPYANWWGIYEKDIYADSIWEGPREVLPIAVITCSIAQRFFDDVQKCVNISPVTEGFLPNDPKGNGISCPANPQNHQPSCGNPINPGTGNKVQYEVDIAVGSSSRLSLSRTYNGGMFNGDQNAQGSFGAWWTQPYDRHLSIQAVRNTYTCYIRSDNQQEFCEGDPIAGAPAGVSVTRPDGKVFTFSQNGNSTTPDLDVDDRVLPQYAADGVTVLGWAYTDGQTDTTEFYDANGVLLSTASRSGVHQSMTYSTGTGNDTSASRYPAEAPICSNVQSGAAVKAGLLLCVTDNWGRQLQFEYDGQGRISKAIDPAYQAYLYAYDGSSGGCSNPSDVGNRACSANNLTQVTYPDGKTRTYHYNEATQINGGTACPNTVAVASGFGDLPNALTGIDDENGVRFATWGYDCNGIATSSQHAGGVEQTTISYGARDSTGAQTVTVTSAAGTSAQPSSVVRNYHYQVLLGVAKNDAVDLPCPGCMATRTYDANSNVATSTDFNGIKTSYSYDLARNLETQRTEASGTPQARTTTTTWHATYRLPLQIAEPKRLTTFAYDSKGNLLTKTVQATTDANGSQGVSASVTGKARTWTYTYNSVGQVLTATGPRTDVNDTTTYSYDQSGNLATVTNAAGHVTTLSGYDANGRVGSIVAPNGDTTNLTYTPRGWLSSRTVVANGSSETTRYSYDGVGQLILVTFPDNSTISYVYDDAHRLTSVSDSLGNSIVYTLDLVGNRISEQVKDVGGQLARQTSRVFDALNNIQQLTGGVQ
jgi:YD repeat-containing protein